MVGWLDGWVVGLSGYMDRARLRTLDGQDRPSRKAHCSPARIVSPKPYNAFVRPLPPSRDSKHRTRPRSRPPMCITNRCRTHSYQVLSTTHTTRKYHHRPPHIRRISSTHQRRSTLPALFIPSSPSSWSCSPRRRVSYSQCKRLSHSVAYTSALPSLSNIRECNIPFSARGLYISQISDGVYVIRYRSKSCARAKHVLCDRNVVISGTMGKAV
jgi:hypothetical protein